MPLLPYCHSILSKSCLGVGWLRAWCVGTSLWNARSKWYTAEPCKTTGAPEKKMLKRLLSCLNSNCSWLNVKFGGPQQLTLTAQYWLQYVDQSMSPYYVRWTFLGGKTTASLDASFDIQMITSSWYSGVFHECPSNFGCPERPAPFSSLY